MRWKKKQNNMLEKASFQPGMTWRFGKILYCHIPKRLYGQTTFSTWRPYVSRDSHSLVRRTGTGVFMVLLQRISTVTLCCFACEVDGKCFLFTSILFNMLFFINIFNWQYFYLIGYDSWTRVMPDGVFLLKHICGVITAKKGCISLWIVELDSLWFVGFQPFF